LLKKSELSSLRASSLKALWRRGIANSPDAQLALQKTTAPSDRVEDQDNQRDHQQKVNQPTGEVEAEAQQS